ncbi:putative nuclease HARBI1 [Uranotaenia lowii]|uniref:putative nuclease HARBI1 n=1 Tax=Uranotaenia lowii TaxID=190385 RepID=UPI00247A89CF|nr:putative nuclease HARBI1 [Uranotaenia lowii]
MFFYGSDSDDDCMLAPQRCQLRDKSDPLSLNENQFRQYFRVSREAFKNILETTEFPQTSKSSAIPSTLKLAATLNLLASGSYQTNVGASFLLGMAQPTVSTIFSELISLLEETLCEKWIGLNTQSFNETKKHYFDKFKIPGVIGCIDGTHIPILRPTKDEHMYFNRKGFHSINAMIITDHNYRILAINPRFDGAAHDSFVWDISAEREFFEENFRNGESRLLGEETIARVSSVKDLGITMDTKLTFDEHISASISRAYVTLGFIRRNTQNFRDIYCLRTLFCTHVRSILEYGIQI